jgi:hypothetical protein
MAARVAALGVLAAGFAVAATSLLGVNRARTAPLRLRRTEIDTFDDETSFTGKVRGDYDWYQLKQRLYWPVPALDPLSVATRGSGRS